MRRFLVLYIEKDFTAELLSVFPSLTQLLFRFRVPGSGFQIPNFRIPDSRFPYNKNIKRMITAMFFILEYFLKRAPYIIFHLARNAERRRRRIDVNHTYHLEHFIYLSGSGSGSGSGSCFRFPFRALPNARSRMLLEFSLASLIEETN